MRYGDDLENIDDFAIWNLILVMPLKFQNPCKIMSEL